MIIDDEIEGGVTS